MKTAVDVRLKRCFDLIMSLLALIILSPALIAVAICIKATSQGPVFYRQERVGREGRTFLVFKFRTMVPGSDRSSRLTPSNDHRVTVIGRILRRTNVDEVPQLINVIRGDLSLVGPRPEVPEYVDLESAAWQAVLSVRPGLTSPETLTFRQEGLLLASAPDPELFYRTVILPKKLALAQNYVSERTFFYDLKIIGKTIIDILRPGTYSNESLTGEDRQHAEDRP